MFLGKGPALELLAVPSGNHLSTGRLDNPAGFPVFFHKVKIDDLSGIVLVSHILSFLPVKPLGQLLNMHFQKSSFNHFFHAVPTEDVDRLGCPYALLTAGTNQFPCAGPLRLLPAVFGSALSGLASAIFRRSPGPAVPVNTDFRPALLNDVFQELVSRLCNGPAVFFVMLNNQSPPFCFVPEFSVVVHSAS